MSAELDNQRSTSRPSLGVVAISYNEERDLPRFLEHLVPWVDEIVIVDDGSQDRTVEIATAAGSKVTLVQSPRGVDEYYSHQRNKGIDAATSDWLLHMDIDERVPPELAEEILKAIADPDFDAYRFRRLNYFLHRPMRGGGWQTWNQVHLARRSQFRFGGMFHETCLVDAPPARIGQLQQRMHHLNDIDYVERLSKSRRYVDEIAKHLQDELQRRERRISCWGVVYRMLREFCYRYFYRLGFRDGALGILSAGHSAAAVFQAGLLTWDAQHRQSRDQLESELHSAWANQTDVDGSTHA